MSPALFCCCVWAGDFGIPVRMKKTTPVAAKKENNPGLPSSPYSRLHTLLHMVRCIAQHEDALCELSHEVKRAGVLSDEAKVALDGILKRMPAEDYVHDLDAVTGLLAGVRARTGSGVTRKVAAAPGGKRMSVAKKAAGAKSAGSSGKRQARQKQIPAG